MSKSKIGVYLVGWLFALPPIDEAKQEIVSDFGGKLEDCPLWSFDGSSTQQAEVVLRDCLLKPVALFPDPDRKRWIFSYD